MSARIKVVVPYPPSGNIYWRKTKSGRLYESDEAKIYKATVAKLLVKEMPIFGKIIMSGEIYQPADQGDLDNFLKVLKDALKFHAYLDDKQVKRYGNLGFNLEQRDYPRCELIFVGERFATHEEKQTAIREHLGAKAQRRATLKRNEKLRELGLLAKPERKRVKKRKDIHYPLAVPAVVPPPKIE